MAVLYGNVIRYIVEKSKSEAKCLKRTSYGQRKKLREKKEIGIQVKMDPIVKEMGIQVKLDPIVKEIIAVKCDMGTQTQKEIGLEMEVEEDMDKVFEDIQKGAKECRLFPLLSEIMGRVAKLEERQEPRKVMEETGRQGEWTKVIGRKRKDNVPEIIIGKKSKEEGTKEDAKGKKGKRRLKSFKALERKKTRGAGIILELQGGRPEDYVEVVKRCEKEIPLEEMGIPPSELGRQGEGGC